ncbi:hypothetical protein DH2020_018753 [Rehmannia glutinosa]|uniref:Uncharacterized protein n=1 Tax=Rehmannia glutinosa TaxID=99300 RepID=A0ABR0WML6_REHGL
MSFFQQNMLTSISSNFDEQQWVKQIRQTLDEELEEETHEIPITIFAVPKAIMLTSPDAYIPQQISIGPYHHFQAEVYDMERYKVAATKRNQKELQNVKFQDFVNHLIKFELRVRASYQRPVTLGPEALAWMMAVDACFLFEFFQVCGVKKGKVLTKTPSRLAHLIDLSGNKTAHNAILRDIVLLENQIPLFVMRMLLEFQFSSLDLADELLLDVLIGLSAEISPFKIVGGPQKIAIKECAHLLDFLYHFIVPKLEVPSEIIEIHHEDEDEEKDEEEKNNSFSKPSHLRHLLDVTWQILSNLKSRPLEWIKTIIFSKPLKLILQLPWTILTKIPIIKMMKGPIENMLSTFKTDKEKTDEDKSSSNSNNKPPLLEEIKIPSVTQLFEVGVQFLPTNEGITSINFDEKNLTFYIPIIELDVNSKVVLRNLVAYEACSTSGPLILTRFVELMNGIIDTDEDAKLLCQRGIVINHLKSEKEVADLWNGMSKSVRLTKVPCLDKVIGDVNKYYNGRWKVKVGNFMKKYVFGSWRILTFLAAIMMLLLMCLQAFCQVYSCSSVFPIKALEPMNQS